MIWRTISFNINRARVSIRDFGVMHTCMRGVLGPLSLLFQRREYVIYVKDLRGVQKADLRNPGVEFTFLSPQDATTLEQIEKLSGLSRDMVRDRVAADGECVVARSEGAVVGFNLVSTGVATIRYLNMKFPLTDTEAWSDQITVAPAFRRGGLASDLRNLMFQRLIDRGYASLIGGYVPFNTKSGALAKKLGFVETEKITLVEILKRKKLSRNVLSPVRPQLSLEPAG